MPKIHETIKDKENLYDLFLTDQNRAWEQNVLFEKMFLVSGSVDFLEHFPHIFKQNITLKYTISEFHIFHIFIQLQSMRYYK